MYIRKSTRSYKGRTYSNYVLVESVQTPKGPRQKSICSLGDLGPRRREEWLRLTRKIEDALVGQNRLLDQNDPEADEIIRRVRNRNGIDGSRAGVAHADRRNCGELQGKTTRVRQQVADVPRWDANSLVDRSPH